MMSLRRWLTSRYDWTGLSRLFYKSWRYELGAIILVAVLTVIGFLAYGFSQGSISSYGGPDAFLPSSTIHIFDWALAIVLLAFLLSNAARMWWFTMGRDKTLKIGLGDYISRSYLLVVHFFTQKRYSKCERKSPWLVHLLLMLSYVTMLILIMFFLVEMASGPSVDWRVHVFGLPAAAGLIVASIVFLRRRITKSSAAYKHSHESDWIFLVMLLLVTATGMQQHLLHRMGAEVAANLAYVLHLMLVVPMLVLEVPFSKWSHLAYRPLAVYLAEVQRDALVRSQPQAVGHEPAVRAA
jgi:hypothetical protein